MNCLLIGNICKDCKTLSLMKIMICDEDYLIGHAVAYMEVQSSTWGLYPCVKSPIELGNSNSLTMIEFTSKHDSGHSRGGFCTSEKSIQNIQSEKGAAVTFFWGWIGGLKWSLNQLVQHHLGLPGVGYKWAGTTILKGGPCRASVQKCPEGSGCP